MREIIRFLKHRRKLWQLPLWAMLWLFGWIGVRTTP
jgi:hypothetical protein